MCAQTRAIPPYARVASYGLPIVSTALFLVVIIASWPSSCDAATADAKVRIEWALSKIESSLSVGRTSWLEASMDPEFTSTVVAEPRPALSNLLQSWRNLSIRRIVSFQDIVVIFESESEADVTCVIARQVSLRGGPLGVVSSGVDTHWVRDQGVWMLANADELLSVLYGSLNGRSVGDHAVIDWSAEP